MKAPILKPKKMDTSVSIFLREYRRITFSNFHSQAAFYQ